MLNVLIQNLTRKQQKKIKQHVDDSKDIQKAADSVVAIIFVTLIVMIVGSVAFAN